MSNKTIGIYKVTSNFNTEEAFKLVGASSQIEVCTRDYMSWCSKGKAPKSMQAEYDRMVAKDNVPAYDPKAIFKVDILKAVETLAELDAAKAEFGLSGKGGKPKTDKAAKTPKAAKEVVSAEDALKKMGTLDGTPAPEPVVEPEPTVEPVVEPAPEPVVETEQPVIGKMGYEAMYREYQAGKSVKDICAENGISKSSFYNNTKQFKA
jgi:hypothetical protein